jgi:hypothetical protein
VSESQATPGPSPVYADRETGEKFLDAKSMINAYLARFADHAELAGEDGARVVPALDDTGYAQVRRGSATIGVNVLDQHGVLMVFAPIMQVPLAGREAFFKKLLELSFVQSSDAAFAINADQDEVVVRSLRRLSGLDFEEFEDILSTVGEVADTWDDVLVREWGG